MKTETPILSYEVPGNCPGFIPQVYVPLTQEEVETKIVRLVGLEKWSVSVPCLTL